MRAKDIMRRGVITVEAWLTLPELAKVFEERDISGAPVVDERGAIVGVVSRTDLVRAHRESPSPAPLFHAESEESASGAGMHIEAMDERRVREIMTPGGIAYDEDTPVEDLAEAMLERHIHRVLITRGKDLRGIVTTMDMLKALARTG
jgi:CBS domain-containing protein